ncbi:hypothetical protein O6H91_10G038400 [Diphasiastrum complanatum]|uniref:Uncharacterized protein n=1 Tax=Diphasiastrum complanatum TaxID=34168 RepID=A0ACC2CG73_DIPCM|nr:hypothetical protein O6H91_10G038400 [Diphasiastrum complanatum]
MISQLSWQFVHLALRFFLQMLAPLRSPYTSEILLQTAHQSVKKRVHTSYKYQAATLIRAECTPSDNVPIAAAPVFNAPWLSTWHRVDNRSLIEGDETILTYHPRL